MVDSQVPSTKKGRSPSYPAIPLGRAVERARVLYEREEQHPAAIETIHRHWNYSPNSGPANLALAALKKYGLLVDEGSGKMRRARLTPLAVTILQHPEPSQRAEATRTAALTPPIHRELWDEFKGRLPSDENLHWMLHQDRNFTKTGAREFVSQLKQTVEYAQLADAATVDRQDGSGGGDGDSLDPDPPDAGGRRRKSDMTGDTLSIPVPILGGSAVTVAGQFPISEAAWAQFIAVLDAMKPGLVAQHEPPED